ncbi:MAG: hypothetical protein AAGE59_25780 [Cyanobacteria bacterium P01_F01_bin.86]
MRVIYRHVKTRHVASPISPSSLEHSPQQPPRKDTTRRLSHPAVKHGA